VADPRVVAMIEDDPILRAPIARALDEAGYAVLSAATSAEGLALLQDVRCDVAIIDIALPGHFDGVTLAEEARRANPDLNIIFTSGKRPGGGRPLDDLGIFLQKPYRVGDLLLAVARLIRRAHGPTR